MTKKEYIESLVEQGLTAKEISPLADAYVEEIVEEEIVEDDTPDVDTEEVKTEVVADQTDAAAATTPDNATEEKNTDSQSKDGSSDYLTVENPAQRKFTKTAYIRNLQKEGKSLEEIKTLSDAWEVSNSPKKPPVNYKPNQVVEAQTKDGFQYKFDIDPEDKNKGIYYRKKIGEEDWENLSQNDGSSDAQVIEASAANLFGHNEFDEEAKGKYLKSIADQQKEFRDKKAAAVEEYNKTKDYSFLEGRWENAKTILGAYKDGAEGIIEGDEDKIVNAFYDWTSGGAQYAGEMIEGILDLTTFGSDIAIDLIVEPTAWALDKVGIMDLENQPLNAMGFGEIDEEGYPEYDDLLSKVITKYTMSEAGAYGEDYDFTEEVGDKIEAGLMDIGGMLLSTPQLMSDMNRMVVQGVGNVFGARESVTEELIESQTMPLAWLMDTTEKEFLVAAEKGYNRFALKSEQLNLTLAQFDNEFATGDFSEGFSGLSEGEFTGENIAKIVSGSTRTISSALGSLPSVAQSMIPYVGIASIVVGSAAKANMDSKQEGRELDSGRLLHAITIGASEGLLELVTKKIGVGMFKNLSGASKPVIEQTLRKTFLNVAKEFGQEGLSEVSTELINSVADEVYKGDGWRKGVLSGKFLPPFRQLMDTFMIGGVMGGGMSGVGNGTALIKQTIQRNQIESNLKTAGVGSLIDNFSDTVTGLEDSNQKIKEEEKIAIEANKNTDNNINKSKQDTSQSVTISADGNIKSTDQTSQEAVDQSNAKAEAQVELLNNPATEMFLNTELKRQEKAGVITKEKAKEIKDNFKRKQKAAGRVKAYGLKGALANDAITLLAEQEKLQEQVKLVNNKGLTKVQSERIAEIDKELEEIAQAAPRTQEALEARREAVDADVAFTEKEAGKIGTKDGEFTDAVGENKAVQTFESTEKFNEFLAENNIPGDANTDAVILPNGQILINKQHMREAGAIGAGRHELLHKILKSQFNGPNGEKLKNDFLKILEQTDPQGYALLMQKMELYSEQELKDAPDEYLTQYASLLAEGEIPLETFVEKPSLVKRLGNFFSNIFSDAANENTAGPNVKPSDINFKDGKDLYDFVRGYVKDSESGVLSDRAKTLADQGKNIKATEKKSKTLTPLEAINDLIPTEIQTKEQFDKFMRSEKDAKAIADALQPGGVINNYIRSKQTSQEQGNKMLDEMYERIFNFNPEATRADGSKVGTKGFGESIFANTRFAKMVANKALAEKSERQKQERSIDSGTLQIAEDTTTSKKDDTKVAKKPSETTGFDKTTESRIDEAVNKSFKGDDVKFSETKNVPKEVADIYGEMFGINPQTITDKTRNYSKKDAEGLTKAKQFLLKNAKNDYARLPELKDDFGKGTFVPKNVKDALYTDGKLTGTLKDYMDLIREKPVKPIYRDRVGQTIRGLLNLSIRNRILETAQPLQAKRIQSGAKFSRTVIELIDNRLFNLDTKGADSLLQKYIGKGIHDINSEKGIDEYFDDLKRVVLPLFPKGFISKTMLRPSNRIFSKNGKKSITVDGKETTIDEYYTKKRNELLSDPKQVYGKPFTGAAKGFKQRVYENWLGNTPAKLEKSNKNGRIKEFNAQNASMHKQMWSRINESIKKDKNNARAIANLLKMVGNLKTHPHRLGAELVGWSPNPKEDKDRLYEWEHAMPATASYLYLLDSALGQNVDFNNAYKLVMDNYKLIALDKAQNSKLGTAGLGTKMPKGWNVLNNSWIERYFNSEVSKINGGIDPSSIIGLDGKSFANIFKIKANGQPTTESLIKESKTAVKKNDNTFGEKTSLSKTTDGQVKTLSDYDKTLKFSRSLNTKPKGISVFDFDDTLAKTKEKVIVNKADGTTIEISAAKFAEQASELQEDGATFNFDNFENVGKGTQKGPLADLALRRQGKFGSKDIFVLTARPQIAATGIKTFLDGIGLNLPLENITGLEDGSPQAKATWVISKTAEGYNDFYFADDAIGNVKAVKDILDQVDVKSKVQQAKYSKSVTFDKIMNNIIEGKTGIKAEAEFSKARAQTVGAKKGRFTFLTTPSAEDFKGLLYRLLGKGKVGDAQSQFFKDNLYDPYNRAEQAVTRAKISAANDFKTLKNSLKTLPKSLSKLTGIGGFTFAQAARVAVWTRQGMEVPGLSKRDAKELNDFIDNNAELDVFVDELINIQKGKPYPKPGQNWLAGNITSDIVNEINKVNRKEYMQEFNENLDIILSEKVMNKLEAAYGPRYVEALRDQIRRMKSGSNRPVGNSRIVDQILNWLNNSVGAIMFLNTRSAVLQTISAVNFINFGNNNLIAAGKALLNQKQYWKDFMTLMNSPYLTERRDGLKINVSESEIADAVSESSNKPKAFLNLLLSKGFILTRIADSFAIAAGGSTFYRNQIKAYMKSGMDQKSAEKQAFDDFYAIAEESQQSSNPSKISQQQASGAGRVILAFANTPMQYARIMKRAGQDLINGRGDWKTNVSKIVYYGAIQNLVFNALSNALFALMFDEEDEEKDDKTGRIANGMADSLLRGLGIQGAAVAAIKDALFTIYEQANKDKGGPEFRKAINDLFGFSPPLDAKIRKLNSGLNTLSWEREKMEQEGFNLNNPAYLAYAQVIAGLTNIPLDRAIQKINNLRAATSDSSAKWQKVALLMGWSAWDLGLPYYGVEDKEVQTPQTILRDKVLKMKKETSGAEQKQTLLNLGLTKQQIKALKYEDVRIKKIIELQNKKKKDE